MDDKDWIFQKLPNWLRWILFLPVAVIASIIIPILARISHYYMFGSSEENIILDAISLYSSVVGFIYGAYYCIPYYKEKICGIISIILTLINFIPLIINVYNQVYFVWDNLKNIIAITICIYIAVQLLSFNKFSENNYYEL